VLGMTSDWSIDWHGATITNFHALFALSVLLRSCAAVLAVHLPDSHPRVPVWKMLGVVLPQPLKLMVSGVNSLRVDDSHVPPPVLRRPRRNIAARRAA